MSSSTNLQQYYALLAARIATDYHQPEALAVSDASCHVMISRFSPNSKALGNEVNVWSNEDSDLPGSDPTAWEKTWAVWSNIVYSVLGALSLRAAGWWSRLMAVTPCCVLYIGWGSLYVWDPCHHHKHFRTRAVILLRITKDTVNMMLLSSVHVLSGRRICRAGMPM